MNVKLLFFYVFLFSYFVLLYAGGGPNQLLIYAVSLKSNIKFPELWSSIKFLEYVCAIY